MKIKNYKKTERFEVCNCCGKAFTAEENMERHFMMPRFILGHPKVPNQIYKDFAVIWKRMKIVKVTLRYK